MRILYIVPYTPNPIRVRPYNLIRGLVRRGHQVTLATLWTTDDERGGLERLSAEGVQVIAERLPPWRSLWNCLRALPTRTPMQAVYCWQPALARSVQYAVRNTQYDVIHVEHLRGAQYSLRLGQNPVFLEKTGFLRVPIIWDSVDCISYLFEQASENSRTLKGRLMTRLELERTRRYEAWLLHQFERVLVTSEVDRQALSALLREAPRRIREKEKKEKRGIHERTGRANVQFPISNFQSPISVLPNGVDLDYFTPTDEPRELATLVITGKMSYHANITAVLHLVHDIMPLVWRERPDVQVWIVGKDPPRPVRDLANRKSQITDCRSQIANRRLVLSRAEGSQSAICNLQSAIHVTGTVPDIRPYLCQATIAVAPVPYGTGVQNKVLEAMACGTLVVASPQAVSALDAQAGRDLVVAEGAAAFARAVLALLDDPASRAQLSHAGRAYVEQHHAWDAIVGQLERVYRDVAEERGWLGEGEGE